MRVRQRASWVMVAASVAVGAGCGGTARPPAAPPAAPAPARPVELPLAEVATTVLRVDEPARLLARVLGAYELAGHTCRFDKDGDLMCDEADSGTPTHVLSTARRGAMFAITIATLNMPLPQGLRCADLEDYLARTRQLLPAMTVACEDDKLALGAGLTIPEAGVTVRELNAALHTFLAGASLAHHQLRTIALAKGGGGTP